MLFFLWRAVLSTTLYHFARLIRPSTAPAGQSRLPVLGTRACWLAGLLVLCACYVPWLYLFFGRLFRSEYYQHFPLLLVAAGWLLVRRSQGPPVACRGGTAGVLAALTLLLLAAGQLITSPWLVAVSALFLLLTLLRVHGVTFANSIPAWLLLWLMIPFPLDQALAYKFQELACHMAGALLEVWSVNHLVSGLTIETAHGVYLVKEACSGMRSQFALLASVAVGVVWWPRFWAASLLLVGAVLPVGILANAIRIAVTVVGDPVTGGLLVQDFLHLPLGMVTFLLCLALLYHWAGILDTICPRRSRRVGQLSASASRQYDVQTQLSWTLGLAAAAVAISLLAPLARRAEATWGGAEVQQLVFSEEDLPANMDGWRRLAFEIQERDGPGRSGPCSIVWRYDQESRSALISCDYPFAGWHGLENCYRNLGWQVTQRRGVEATSHQNAVEFELSREDGALGYLIYSEHYSTGEPLRPLDPAEWSCGGVVSYGLNRVRKGVGRFGQARSVFQLQLFSVVDGEVAQAELRGLFFSARERLLRVIEDRCEEYPPEFKERGEP